MAYDWMLAKRKDKETETERTLNDLMDRGIITGSRLKFADTVVDTMVDKYLKRKENKYRNTEQKLGILERSRALGLSARQALNDDFLEEEAEEESARNLVLAKRAANALESAPKAFAQKTKISNTFSKLISALKYR
jgi:hypothetical protein